MAQQSVSFVRSLCSAAGAGVVGTAEASAQAVQSARDALAPWASAAMRVVSGGAPRRSREDDDDAAAAADARRERRRARGGRSLTPRRDAALEAASAAAQFALATAAALAVSRGVRSLRRRAREQLLHDVAAALEAVAAEEAHPLTAMLDFWPDFGTLRALARDGRLPLSGEEGGATDAPPALVVVKPGVTAGELRHFAEQLQQRLTAHLPHRYQVWVARAMPLAGAPYCWLRVRMRHVPAAFASLDVHLGELLPPPRQVASSASGGRKTAAAAAKEEVSKAPRLVALFSAAAHAPAPLVLPTRRGALPCPACARAARTGVALHHALRGPADAEALLRHRFGAGWRAGAGDALRATEAPPPPPPPVLVVRGVIVRVLRALGMRI